MMRIKKVQRCEINLTDEYGGFYTGLGSLKSNSITYSLTVLCYKI
jgi:hypothetical protein